MHAQMEISMGVLARKFDFIKFFVPRIEKLFLYLASRAKNFTLLYATYRSCQYYESKVLHNTKLT